MKARSLILSLIFFATLAMCSRCPAYDLNEILAGMDRRETIIVRTASNVTYMAESTIGMSHTTKAWVCSKVIETTDGTNTITVITYMPTLQVPGTNGVNLATFNYPND